MLSGKTLIIGVWLIFVNAQQLSNCVWKNTASFSNSPEVFWVNLDRSPDRKETMRNHLSAVGLINRRVKGLTLDDIHFPKDILHNWDKYESQIETTQFPSELSSTKSHVVSGLVGRAKTNKLKEIGCTSSHLEAIRQAIYENKTSSPYALITEDDIQIPFDIDFNVLAATAPPGWGILQVFNSNEESMASTWNRFVKKGDLWTERTPKQPAAFWSTCAYLINRAVMRPIIDKIAFRDQGWINLKIIAGIKQPCRPKLTACCEVIQNTSSYKFIDEAPCFWAPKGFQADSFIYALAKTYVLGVPIITNSAGGNQSTFHQDHVESIHQSAFARQRMYINELITQKVALPSFLSLACREPVTIAMAVSKRPPCAYTNRTESVTSVTVYMLSWKQRLRYAQLMSDYLTKVVGLRHIAVSASSNSSDLIIPSDIRQHWGLKTCIFSSSEIKALNFPLFVMQEVSSPSDMPRTHGKKQPKLKMKTLTDLRSADTAHAFLHSSQPAVVPVSQDQNQQQFPLNVISGLCGRGKGHNSLEDLAILVGHLKALHVAVFGNGGSRGGIGSTGSGSNEAGRTNAASSVSSTPLIVDKPSSDFALIIDDDVYMPFDIDYDALSRSAPSDFGILRLYQSSEHQIDRNYQKYVYNNSYLWADDKSDKLYDPYAAKAYIIHKSRLRVILQHIVTDIELLRDPHSGPQTAIDYKVLAGLHNPCIPIECCGDGGGALVDANIATGASAFVSPNRSSIVGIHTTTSGTGGSIFNAIPPCVDSRKGFQAERFLFRLAPTYVLTVPLIVSKESLNMFNGSFSAKAAAAFALSNSSASLPNAAFPFSSEMASMSRRHIAIMNDFLSERTKLPKFAVIGCNSFLE